MLPPGVRLATFLLGASVIATSLGAFAQPGRPGGPSHGAAAPHAMARPSQHPMARFGRLELRPFWGDESGGPDSVTA